MGVSIVPPASALPYAELRPAQMNVVLGIATRGRPPWCNQVGLSRPAQRVRASSTCWPLLNDGPSKRMNPAWKNRRKLVDERLRRLGSDSDERGKADAAARNSTGHRIHFVGPKRADAVVVALRKGLHVSSPFETSAVRNHGAGSSPPTPMSLRHPRAAVPRGTRRRIFPRLVTSAYVGRGRRVRLDIGTGA